MVTKYDEIWIAAGRALLAAGPTHMNHVSGLFEQLMREALEGNAPDEVIAILGVLDNAVRTIERDPGVLGLNDAGRTSPPCVVGDVVQLNPERLGWAPLLALVGAVESWGVKGVVLVPKSLNQRPALMAVQLLHGQYERVGRAVWALE